MGVVVAEGLAGGAASAETSEIQSGMNTNTLGLVHRRSNMNCPFVRLLMEVMFQDSTISWARYGLLTPG
jgi:hypothetical protein